MVYRWICLMVDIIKYYPWARTLLGLNDEEVFRRGKEESLTVRANGLLRYWAAEKLGISQEVVA
jgi:hypothetical protein